MNLDEFWNLIDKVNAETTPNDKKAILEAIKKALVEYTPEEIVDWVLIKTEYHKLAAYNKALWETCAELGLHDDVDDGFYYYFSPWLIAQGKETYCTVIHDPKTLSNYAQPGDDVEFELFHHVPLDAYSERVIKDSFTEKELENLCEQWCADNEEPIERYSYQANVDKVTGGEKLFWEHMHMKYNLYDIAEARPLSEEMKQEIKNSLTIINSSLAEMIHGAESARVGVETRMFNSILDRI